MRKTSFAHLRLSLLPAKLLMSMAGEYQTVTT